MNRKASNEGSRDREKTLRYCHAGFAAFLAFGLAILTPSYSFQKPVEKIGNAVEEATERKSDISQKLSSLEEILRHEAISYFFHLDNEKRMLEGRTITFYNPVSSQTDDTPCEGAWTPQTGINFCNTKIPIVATRALDMGTLVIIEDAIYVVADKPHERYGSRFDILVNSKKDMEWGKKTANVEIIGRLVTIK